MPFRTMGIMWDGNVRTCTGAPNSDFSGNVFTQGFEAVWRQGSRRGRRLVAARDWTALEALQVCCAQCDINDQLPSLSELSQSRPGHAAADKFLIRQEEIGRTRPMGD